MRSSTGFSGPAPRPRVQAKRSSSSALRGIFGGHQHQCSKNPIIWKFGSRLQPAIRQKGLFKQSKKRFEYELRLSFGNNGVLGFVLESIKRIGELAGMHVSGVTRLIVWVRSVSAYIHVVVLVDSPFRLYRLTVFELRSELLSVSFPLSQFKTTEN